ncbi:Leucine-rich repeat-containing protein 49 [Phytophthora citrophthora]|uniref:Leucine-rich repeat-containing protein 49 n=1 Tax=Phytophthora citrophthora TaxID=4793 RepID=A0AAD9H0V4_9STRA|nr:Leucine-rich repeat-containing protein 49 [Phytophthora citrophthora]
MLESIMEAAYLSGSTSGMMASAATPGGPPVPRRSEGNVTLGLFSKIAAARKENLSTFSKAATGDLGPPCRSYEKKSMTPGAFPELNDPSIQLARNPALRTPAINERKANVQSYSHNLRWTKQSVPEEPLGAVGSPATVNGSIFNASGSNRAGSATSQRSTPVGTVAPASRRRHLLPPHQQLYQQRRSTVDSSTEFAKGDRETPTREPLARPATASEVGATLERNTYPISRISRQHQRLRQTPGWCRQGESLHSEQADVVYPRACVDGRIRASKTPDTTIFTGSKTPGVADQLANGPNQEVHFAVTAEIPGVPIVYRNQKTKATNPERLNLDRRNLPVIPLLEGEQILRLLNLQNNVIRRIENLLGLPNLIFLDLYNNRIEKLENLHLVPNLRVLMMGKNRLRTIENLECLKKLDVLDLHSNAIEQMQNLNELTELRVLNLGGNMISTVENVDKLLLLTELNLRRNRITHIGTIGKLPSLLRLFLSNNKLETFESIEALFQVSSINELRLDSNGVCTSNQGEYRGRMIRRFPSLKHLDLKPLSEADRKEAVLHANSPGKDGINSGDTEATARAHAISCIKATWERRAELIHSPMSSKNSRDLSSLSTWGLPASEELKSHAGYEAREATPTTREESTVHNNNVGFSEVEVYGDYRVLVIYGDALDALELAKAQPLVNAVSFRYVSITKIMAAVGSVTIANLKLFTRLRRLIFAYNDLQSFDELSWLGSLGSKAEEVSCMVTDEMAVFISQNPVCAKTLLKRYIGARISNTLRVNGEEITPTDRQIGKQLFPKPIAPRVRSSEPPELSYLLPSKARVREVKDSKSSRSSSVLPNTVTSSVVTEIFDTASNIAKKTALTNILLGTGSSMGGFAPFHCQGLFSRTGNPYTPPALTFYHCQQETLQDIERRDSFMSGCLDNL